MEYTILTLMDAQSGNPLLFIADHYRVKDWDVLSKILASKKDIGGEAQANIQARREISYGLLPIMERCWLEA